MAILNGNAPYLTLGGTDVAAKFIDIKPENSVTGVDVTHGAATFVQRNAGLRDTSFTITLAYDIATVSGFIQTLKPGTLETLDFGPEGNTSGKPRHTQSILVEKVTGPSLSVKKDRVDFALTCSGADAPTNDMYAGATF